ncbi:MAG: hypothetical protein DHS20C02_06540 [Micavibrio sp.]|nr:MAG: hypothetical protein DHS20C02_06540 [Micavibrio sp.]
MALSKWTVPVLSIVAIFAGCSSEKSPPSIQEQLTEVMERSGHGSGMKYTHKNPLKVTGDTFEAHVVFNGVGDADKFCRLYTATLMPKDMHQENAAELRNTVVFITACP